MLDLVQVQALEKKGGKQAALQQALKDSLNRCLVGPFVDAAIRERRQACTTLTHSWRVYLDHMQVLPASKLLLHGIAVAEICESEL